MNLRVAPISFKDANAYVAKYHRHHKRVAGCKFCLSVMKDGQIVGVAIVGRPVARMLDDGKTVEVNRCCTDGTKNACSMLYGAAWRAARALGYQRCITYTLKSEGGASLRASNFRLIGQAGGGKWSRENRPREDQHPTELKLRWEAPL